MYDIYIYIHIYIHVFCLYFVLYYLIFDTSIQSISKKDFPSFDEDIRRNPGDKWKWW